MKKNKFKLTTELVPSTSWYTNLRKAVSPLVWNRIRKESYQKYNHRCGICGALKRLNCHEIWEYNDEKHIQKLIGFIALCDMCHHVKHLGFAQILASQGKLNFEDVIKHFMKVNGCSRKDFEEYSHQVFKKWEERSQCEWKVDLGEYEKLVFEKDYGEDLLEFFKGGK